MFKSKYNKLYYNFINFLIYFIILLYNQLKMNQLKNEDVLKIIISKSKELGITAYEFGANTSISTMTAHNILSGDSINPRRKTLNIMLQYLENKKLNSAAEDAAHYLTLHNFTPNQIVAYIHNNKELFKNNEMYQLLIKDEGNDAVIARLKAILSDVKSK